MIQRESMALGEVHEINNIAIGVGPVCGCCAVIFTLFDDREVELKDPKIVLALPRRALAMIQLDLCILVGCLVMRLPSCLCVGGENSNRYLQKQTPSQRHP